MSSEKMAIGGAGAPNVRNPFITTIPPESKKIDSDDAILGKAISEGNVNLKGLGYERPVRQTEGIPKEAYVKFAQGSLAYFDVSNCNPFQPESRTAEQGQNLYMLV